MSKKLESLLINHKIPREIRQLKWKGIEIPNYEISNDGILYKNGIQLSSWKVNGRNYSGIIIDGHKYHYRIDYMVAYTFIGMYNDAIRLIHINEDISDDHLINLMWYRKIDILKEYIDLAIIESDGSIQEEWRPCITEYNPDLGYEVSNFGMIRDSNKQLIPLRESHGYRVFYYIDANFASKTRIKTVHRSVAEAFIPNPNNYELVNHLDGDGFNDVVYNLEWATSAMNMEHAYLQNLNNKAKYTIPQIHAVCDLLSRRRLSHVQISYMTGVDRKTISDIYRGRRWKDISCSYIFNDRKWNKFMKEEVCNLIIEGKKGREIFEILKMDYDQSSISFYERMRRELKSLGKIA